MPLIKTTILWLYGVLLVMLAIATFAGHAWGISWANRYIYHSIPFCLLWGMLAAFTLYMLYQKRLWKRLPVFMLHLSFILILGGALITFLSGKKGSVHLRIGTTSFQYMEQETNLMRTMPFTLRLDTFRVEYYPGTDIPSDYVSRVTCHSLNDSSFIQADISMNHVLDWKGYRFYQSSYDEDEGGSWLSVNHDPWGTAVTYSGYILLAFSMVAMLRVRWKRYYGWLLAGVLVTACVLQLKTLYTPMRPVLVSPWFGIHISFIVVSYLLLTLICLNGVVALSLPERGERLMRLSRNLLYPAVFFLGAGIFIGAVWANESWGRYWAWDPKEVWALITFMVYGLPFHTESFPSFRNPRFFHIYVVASLLTVLMTYFGVNGMLGGMHSYG